MNHTCDQTKTIVISLEGSSWTLKLVSISVKIEEYDLFVCAMLSEHFSLSLMSNEGKPENVRFRNW